MDQRKTIYPHQVIKLLRRLRNDSPLLDTKNDDYLADVLGITKDAMLRCLTAEDRGSKSPYRGWPTSQGFDVTRTVDEALLELASNYLGPKAFVRELDEGLKSLDIDLREVIGPVDLYEEVWGGKRSYDVEELRRLCDSVATHCAERNASDTSGRDVAGSGPLSPIVSLLRGGKAQAEGPGLGKVCLDFGEGAVTPLLPDDDQELLAALLPESASRLPRDKTQAIELARWLDEDGGHRFSAMVDRCREVLAPCCNSDLLLSRAETLLEAIANADGRPAALETLSSIRRFAGDDPARTLASAILALIAGPASNRMIIGILRGRWTR